MASKKDEKMEKELVEAMNKVGQAFGRKNIEESFKPGDGQLQMIAVERNIEAHCQLITCGQADPYGDGEQTSLSGREAEIMQHRWGTGGDYNPFENPFLSQWVRDCYNGNLPAVKAQLEKDPTLTEKRESVLRYCALFHVIAGARTINPAVKNYSVMKARLTSKSDHIGCIEYLLKKGARVNARDLAGNTPLFLCTGMLGNGLSLNIAKLLLKHKADINAMNRMGHTPLFEPTITSRFDCIDFLLEHGARVDVTDNDGTILASMGAFYPKLAEKFALANARQAAKDKEEARLAGTYGSCNECKTTSNVRRCSGCFVVWYCGTECQRKDWANHKSRCKSVRKGYKKVTLTAWPVQINFKYLSNVAEMQTTAPPNGISPKLKSKQNFIVKIQIPLALVTSRKMKRNAPCSSECEDKQSLYVYNEDRSVYGTIEPSFEYYNQLVDLIVEKGPMGGAKGYFCAIYDEKEGLKINVEEIQLPQPW